MNFYMRKNNSEMEPEPQERPLPVSPKIAHYLPGDYVSDNGEGVMPLARYNAVHGTSFTLDDVYGEGYEESLSQAVKSSPSSFTGTWGCDEGLVDDGCLAPAKALMLLISKGGDDGSLRALLHDDVRLVLYGARTIEGADAVVDYWTGYRSRTDAAGLTVDLFVQRCGYDGSNVLMVHPSGHARMYVMFHTEEEMVKTMLLAPVSLSGSVRNCSLDDPRIGMEEVRKIVTGRLEIHPAHCMPCLECGEPSEGLLWCSFDSKDGRIGRKGRLSICPDCLEPVEFYPEKEYDCGDEDGCEFPF